jgi:phosphoserine phosphatase
MAIRLVAFDLDGTLIRGRTCVEAIAAAMGRVEESAAFERIPMRDIAGLTAARSAMAEWIRPLGADALVPALAGLQLAPGAEEAFALLRERAIETAIVSITASFAVEWFADRLGAQHAVGTRITATGVEHFWPADKGAWLTALAGERDLAPAEIAAVGDSDGDRELLEAAGLRFFVGRRPPDLAAVRHRPDGDIAAIAREIVAVA